MSGSTAEAAGVEVACRGARVVILAVGDLAVDLGGGKVHSLAHGGARAVKAHRAHELRLPDVGLPADGVLGVG